MITEIEYNKQLKALRSKITRTKNNSLKAKSLAEKVEIKHQLKYLQEQERQFLLKRYEITN